ncbi:Hypothetical Protein FCC1311_031112 [Hondaea fermentalgiana]|uniref:Uncharacterized protein n=1 Tax=Hondaea fermentalgiana TaxID=2315210 RepID=A0A2R5G978_9STRA|nr:Hypothetical Protein FCC1311_031112 [Hondaea fermentalgiana]|eukprot:GBG26889.1 Hypothetical Protein FCC1311_031112 [Hondaea fermentalgiana]
MSHVGLLVAEVLFATPMIYLWQHSEVDGPSGLGWFLFVAAVATIGFVFVCARKCCSSIFLVRCAANAILAVYMLCQLAIVGLGTAYAYAFFYPITGGRAEEYRKRYFIDYDSDISHLQFVIVFSFGGTCSVIMAFLALILTLHAWKVAQITDDIKSTKSKRRQEYDPERQPFLPVAKEIEDDTEPQNNKNTMQLT